MPSQLDSLDEYVTPKNDQPLNDFHNRIINPRARDDSSNSLLTPNQESLLANIGRFPCDTRIERQEKLGWPPQTMQNTIESLTGIDFIRPITLKKGGQGSGYVTYELLDPARQYMAKRKIHFKGLHGGIQHHCAIEQWIQSKREQGFKAKFQPKFGGFKLDAGAFGQKSIGLEVVSSNNSHRDLIKFPHLLSHVDSLEICFTDQSLRTEYENSLRKNLNAESFGRISFIQV